MKKILVLSLLLIVAVGAVAATFNEINGNNKTDNNGKGNTAKKEDPKKPSQPTQKKPSQPTKHIVQEGENVTRIATKYGVSQYDLCAANNIIGDHIEIGQTLIIPEKGYAKESAILGDKEAMYLISKAYMENGEYERSDYWLERAAQEGQADAKEVLKMMGGKTELTAARRSQLADEEKREREQLLAEGKQLGSVPSRQGNLTFTVNGVSFTMVEVDGGSFTMGATSEQGTSDPWDDEKPTHNVSLSSYYIGQTEVTQELWEAVMGSNPSSFKGAKRPVENVSWNECQDFIRKLNARTGKYFRLPTEAEWEYAARGGKSNGCKYSGSNTLSDVAWYKDNSGSTTHDVATKRANELGIYDMSSNVNEWCSDWYDSYSSSLQTNPRSTSGSTRVSRGGCWADPARYCRVSARYGYTPDNRISYLGLRLALSEENSPVPSPPPKKPFDDEVFESAAHMPSFPGGDAALMSYIKKNVIYPQNAKDNNIQGKVIIQFIVLKDGRIGEVKVVQGVSKELDEEAIRVCKTLPKFSPGRNAVGDPVNVWYTLPVTFNLKSKK